MVVIQHAYPTRCIRSMYSWRARHLLILLQSRFARAIRDSRQQKRDGTARGLEERKKASGQTPRPSRAYRNEAHGDQKGWSDTAAFPVLAGATEQLEEVADSETKAPQRGAFLWRRALATRPSGSARWALRPQLGIEGCPCPRAITLARSITFLPCPSESAACPLLFPAALDAGPI